MALQLIFVVETDKRCKSDWIYIKSTLNHFYQYDHTQVKLTSIYLSGKDKYKSKENEINSKIKQFRGNSKVLMCVDCDDYDTNPNDRQFLDKVRDYCNDKGFIFVWFCKDIEQVYLGYKIESSLKKKKAATFEAKQSINSIEPHKLSVNEFRDKTSNLLCVLDQFKELIRIV